MKAIFDTAMTCTYWCMSRAIGLELKHLKCVFCVIVNTDSEGWWTLILNEDEPCFWLNVNDFSRKIRISVHVQMESSSWHYKGLMIAGNLTIVAGEWLFFTRRLFMPAQGVSMHKIKELLRLHFEAKLSQHQIAASLRLSVGVVNKY